MYTLESLFPELIGRIFSNIGVRERCRIIPLLNKELNKINTQHLPQPELWWISSFEDITESRVSFFRKTASSVKVLEVHNDDDSEDEQDTGGLAQLLNVAAAVAPRLQSVELGAMHYCDALSVMYELSFLAKLEELDLKIWGLEGAEHLAGLSSLQDLKLHLNVGEIDEDAAQTFWTALAGLAALSSLWFFFWSEAEIDFCASMSLVTQLSALTLHGDERGCLDEHGEFHKSFAALTRLSSLHLSVTWSWLQSFTGLPLLQDFDLDVSMDNNTSLPVSACTALKGLSNLSLTIQQDWALPLQHIFVHAMPALHELRRLQLTQNLLEDFPAQVAASLKCLTFLNLSSNSFTTFPAAVSQISTLHTLCMDNNEIDLYEDDLIALIAMPALKCLSLVDNGSWSAHSAAVLMNIRGSLPDLVVELEDEQGACAYI